MLLQLGFTLSCYGNWHALNKGIRNENWNVFLFLILVLFFLLRRRLYALCFHRKAVELQFTLMTSLSMFAAAIKESGVHRLQKEM